jgi:hypothetical protein
MLEYLVKKDTSGVLRCMVPMGMDTVAILPATVPSSGKNSLAFMLAPQIVLWFAKIHSHCQWHFVF